MATETNASPPDLEAILHEVERFSSSIEAAKRMGDVICALHSLAIRLFPVDSAALAGVLDEPHRAKVLNVSVPLDCTRMLWKHAFYNGAAFPAVARILIHHVGIDWLACFSHTARVQVYDQFFVNGPLSEIIQALVPCLALDDCGEYDGSNVACSNVERLLVLCLVENRGIYKLAREFIEAFNSEKHACGVSGADFSLISRMARVLTSIPDKARLASPPAFSSHSFFRQVTDQLLDVAEERAAELFLKMNVLQVPTMDGIFSFIGETFGRICRRGSTGTLLATAIPRLLAHVRICMLQSAPPDISIGFQSNPKSVFWFSLIANLKDPYAVEKMSQELLLKLASVEVNDEEAFWALWMLYHKIFLCRSTARLLFSEKFLLDKVFPFCCLRWILHLSVFECPPENFVKIQNTGAFLATTKHLLDAWSKREFVQSAPLEKQAYITAAIGLCLERISKEELETAPDMMNSVLRGVSCRLESPIDIVRKMASSIALMFSKVINPSDPLYLDDSQTDTIDWEFGLISSKKGSEGKSSIWCGRKTFAAESLPSSEITDQMNDNMIKQMDNKSNGNSKFLDAKAINPDEVIDPASMNKDFHLEEYNSESDDSVISNDSLQPYDMTDDEDVKKNISQISDLFSALRKSDDPDGVVQALNIAEKIIRASPDELKHSAGDLVRTFVYLHCSDLAVEGEEDSAEEKRQKALIALLVMCPFESVHVMTELLYSSTLDMSQRILIIDVMTEAVQELSCAKTLRTKHQQTNLISSISDCNSWYLPGNKGPKGSGPWEDVSERNSLLSLTLCFERTLPSRPGQVKLGKSRRWSLPAVEAQDSQIEWSKNRFPVYAAAFMLPAMQGFDKKKHGVDFLGRDFVILGKLIHMLGICMSCVAMHPEASALAPPLLDMLSSGGVSHHPEAYVRRAVLFAASCILVALHPSFVASALMEEHQHISKGLDWIRTWALHVSEQDPDTECTTMAMTCLQLHAEMALQTSRSLESTHCFRSLTSIKSPTVTKDIILPISSIK